MPTLNASDRAKLAKLQTLVVTYKDSNIPQDVQKLAIAEAEELFRKTCANRDDYWANFPKPTDPTFGMPYDDTCFIECDDVDLLLKDLKNAHITPAELTKHLGLDDLFQEDYSV